MTLAADLAPPTSSRYWARMRFGTYHVFQCPPGLTPARVMAEEMQRARLAEELGFDDVWVPE